MRAIVFLARIHAHSAKVGEKYYKDPEAVIDLIFRLFDIIEAQQAQITELTERIKVLEARLNQNSSNSNLPPSSDGPGKPKPKSLRKKSRKKRGGQKGHTGHTLEMVSNPDEIIDLPAPECGSCGKTLRKRRQTYKARQEFDIKITKIVREYRAYEYDCQCGRIECSAFPETLRSKTQYGPTIESLVIYISQQLLVPYNRLSEFIRDVTDYNMSEGTMVNMVSKCADNLEIFEESAKQSLIQAPVVGFDETSIRLADRLAWIHTVNTDNLILLSLHGKRGTIAMNEIGVLPNFKGVAVHDYWKAYFTFDCPHSLCGPHLMRELIFLHEEVSVSWAKDFLRYLLRTKSIVDKAKENGKTGLSTSQLARISTGYDTIVTKCLRGSPINKNRARKRGRIKQSKQRNLAERLRDKKEEILRFAFNFQVPFDNNASERSLRMSKVKQKISGCFRSEKGARVFCRIRSYAQTMRKNGCAILDGLKLARKGIVFVPTG